MITYSNYKLPPGLEYVGDGFTIRKTSHCSGKKAFEFMQALCLHLMAHPDSMIVPVSDFQFLGRNADHDFVYSYDMQRLGVISEEEENLIWQVGDGWRSRIADPIHQFISKPLSTKEVISLERAWQEYPKLMNFLGEIIKQDRYHDLHGENILLDDDANYRIIDLEGFLNSPLSLPENAWLRGK